jgi:hypothetical protein
MTTVERQVRTLLRAWPIPDRVERGDEIVGTTLDLVPDGHSRVPLALAFNLVVGGLRARWHARPPLWHWLSYRMGGRLPARWHRWMMNDLNAPGWRRRIALSRALVALCGGALGIAFTQLMDHKNRLPLHSVVAGSLSFLVVWSIGGAIMVFRSPKLRERQLLRHGYDRSGRIEPPWPPPAPLVQPASDADSDRQTRPTPD